MHEMSIAIQLMAQIEALAAENGATRVEVVELDVGVLEQVVPEALEMAFEAAGDGTVAEGARLDIREVPAEARCRDCGRLYAPTLASYVCPDCGKAVPEIMAGKGMVLMSLECVTTCEDECEEKNSDCQ